MRVILSARKGHSSSEKFTLFKRGPAFPTFAASNETVAVSAVNKR